MKWLVSLTSCFLLCFGMVFSAHAENSQAKKNLTIGILAFEPKQLIKENWQPIIEHVNQQLTHVSLRVEPYHYDELYNAVARREVDFVLTNSAYYVELAHSQGLSSPLASLITSYKNTPLRGFGGVIFTKAERADMQSLVDLKGKRIATPKLGSVGGYMMQAYEMMQSGVNPESYRLVETELPHEKAVQAVLQGDVDAGFVRTGVLESMQERGLIKAGAVRILNKQELSNFPLVLSTRLYPEWPLAAMPHVNTAHAGQVVGVFLTLDHDTPILRDANVYGFSVPVDYEPVRELMRTLKAKPYNIDPAITWRDIWRANREESILAMVALMVIVALSLLLVAYTRRLSRTLEKLQENEENLRISAVAFDTLDAIFITDLNERIIRVNNAFKKLTGYSDKEIVGETPRILSSGMHNADFYRQVWKEIKTFGGWTGELWNRRKSGENFPVQQVITAVKDATGQTTHYLSTFSDITIRKLSEEQIHQLAFYDPLTGLANRRLLEDHITQAFTSSARNKSYCALLFMDLDHFKHLNDTMGHKQGDELLKMVAQRLKESVRDGDTVARQGGDEFIILLEDLGEFKKDAAINTQAISEKILAAINQPYVLTGSQYIVTASIGINLFIDHHETIEELMKRSDLAMYQAKAEGRDAIRFFDPSMQEAAARRSEIEADLRQAIELQQFELYYQPKVNSDGSLHGYEALLRWHHPVKGMIAPLNFIPVAEETGLIVPIGQWVFRQACQTIKQWQQDTSKQQLILAINISARQFRQKCFVADFIQGYLEFDFPPHLLELELTESLLMDDVSTTVAKMKELNQVGFLFALDDFGTGFSSLSYLKNLPLNCLKIDQSFVRDMLVDHEDAAIVETIITLAKTLKLKVIAEGVETEEQAIALRKLGCELMQGYYFGRPAPLT
ncbi:MAG: EAL domain-containing protein [Thiopseudomonas sp.]|nr:EAL domain-containing protein [Thiopseudomonas sp.]MCK9465444.1 EAL domain-containing protein [Thiopseudomonas sp.]